MDSSICLPSEFKTDQVIYETDKEDAYHMRAFFSLALQMVRTDLIGIVEDDKPVFAQVSWIFDYPQGTWYEIIYSNSSSATCNVHHNLTGTLEPPCLSKKAKHRGSIIYGGVATLDNYVEHDNQQGIRVDILLDYNINIPVRAFYRNLKGSYIEEYWNFKTRVDPDDFVIPQVCTSVEPIKGGRIIPSQILQQKIQKDANLPQYRAKLN